MTRFFNLYQYIGPALLTPLAAWLWWRHSQGDVALTAIALCVPILHGYLVPGIGTNVLKMWEFSTRFRIGGFRPQHGFVFGSATALLTLPPVAVASTVTAASLMTGTVLLATNWIYDAFALKAGILLVYNQPHADGASPWAVAGDYVFWFFGVFGLIYGAGLKFAETQALTPPNAAAITLLLTGTTIAVPTLLYMGASWLRYGHSGCRPIRSGSE